MSIASSGTSIPAFLAANNPINTAPATEVSASLPEGLYRHAPMELFFWLVTAAAHRQLQRLANRQVVGRIAAGPQIAIVDRAVGFGQTQHGKAVVVHAVAKVAGRLFLGLNHVANRAADVAGIDSIVGVFAGGQKAHQRHAADSGALMIRRPASLLVLGLRQELQSPVIHLADIAWNRITGADLQRLRLASDWGRRKAISNKKTIRQQRLAMLRSLEFPAVAKQRHPVVWDGLVIFCDAAPTRPLRGAANLPQGHGYLRKRTVTLFTLLREGRKRACEFPGRGRLAIPMGTRRQVPPPQSLVPRL